MSTIRVTIPEQVIESITLEVDVEGWVEAYGVSPENVAQDVQKYYNLDLRGVHLVEMLSGASGLVKQVKHPLHSNLDV